MIQREDERPIVGRTRADPRGFGDPAGVEGGAIFSA